MKILIIEDDVLIGNYIKYVLEKNLYIITGIADNKNDVKSSIKNKPPDVALLDIRLGNNESGIELSAVLSKAQIPFMYLTANNDRDTMKRALATNPVAYITKPFNEPNVVGAIELFRQKNSKNNFI